MIIQPFPKLFALGTPYVSRLADNEVEITEKIDGSQFVFGKKEGRLLMRSKGVMIYSRTDNQMFATAVDYVESIANNIPDNHIFYCEYLEKPKHNTLKYDRVPKNNLILFGVCVDDVFISKHEELSRYALELDIEVVPLIYSGNIELSNLDFYQSLLKRKSVLGGADIEGFVVKNYHQTAMVEGVVLPILSAKYVSEAFKEVHNKNWAENNNKKLSWNNYLQGFRTEARWQKAVQHLQEKNSLTLSPEDIGLLLKEVRLDIIAEEKENIKDFLWRNFSEELLRQSIKGLPEWYKNFLITRDN